MTICIFQEKNLTSKSWAAEFIINQYEIKTKEMSMQGNERISNIYLEIFHGCMMDETVWGKNDL
jgi:hypothetical protein